MGIFFIRDRRKEGIMLHKIIGTIGFILLMLGAGGMDSHSMAVPAVMSLLGMGLLLWTAKTSGVFEQKK